MGGLVGYEQGALWGGVVALFGVLTDWVRSQFYDPWFRFPKPLDSGEVLLYFLMYGLAVLSSEALFWYKPSPRGILVVLLAPTPAATTSSLITSGAPEDASSGLERRRRG